jgi:hypothetical protein
VHVGALVMVVVVVVRELEAVVVMMLEIACRLDERVRAV